MNERELCYKILYDIHYNGELSHVAIKKALDECDLRGETISKPFVTRLVNGEIEKHLTLMFLIVRQAERPEGKIKPVLRIIMAEALYQAIYMDVPSSAAVNEAVKLAKKRRFQNLGGFVNGVLRRCIDNYESYLDSNPGKNIDDYIVKILESEYMDRSESYKLSIMYSCPEWLVKQFLEYMPKEDLKKMFSISPESRALSIYRLENRATEEELVKSLKKDNLEFEKLDGDNVYRIKSIGDIKKYDFFKEGLAIVQDASSAREGELIPVIENAKVLDLCAAPGGKSIHAADKLFKAGGVVTACDISEKKVKLINDSIKRCRLNNITTCVKDASEYEKSYKEGFDIVIADLPCSGLGVIFKKADIKYKTKPEDIEELSQIQMSILEHAVKYVKHGGYIVYSTCTLTKLENETNTEYIKSKGYELVQEETILPSEKQDGFYISVLRRK